MRRIIKKVAILGSGIMGSRIACHFANIGVQVLLLDRIPDTLTPTEEQKGLTLSTKAVRNRIVNESLATAVKSNPAPLYDKAFQAHISTGNFDDDLPQIAHCDWIMEVVIERLDIKQSLYQKVEQFRKPGTIITSNTSGIPIQYLTYDRSADFKAHFCGTHFFNPPRYLPLLEIIPSKETDETVIDFLMHFGRQNLGKTTVLCKDTPAFIANRIGVFSIMALFKTVQELDLSVEEIDKLTGPVFGRPKSATFRTCDLVGIDTLAKVAAGVAQNCPSDEAIAVFELPQFLQDMLNNNQLGDKTGMGFYKKSKSASGAKEILALNLKTGTYQASQKVKFPVLDQAKQIDELPKRLRLLLSDTGKAGEFYRRSCFGLFSYVSFRIPEISDTIYRIDDALRAGFGWELGPFELWDALGLESTLAMMQMYGMQVAPWVTAMLNTGNKSFYAFNKGKKTCYNPANTQMEIIAGTEKLVYLTALPKEQLLWKNSGCDIFDLGDGILNVAFRTKMNSIGSEVLQGIHKAIDMAEKDHQGVVIANEAANFSAGANLAFLFMLAIEEEWDEVEFAIRMFQNTSMRLRYSSIPVVIAPRGLSLGGACEFTMHADKAQAAAETYMGLVEVGAGVIPGGGGTKEMALRVSDRIKNGDVVYNHLSEAFMQIATAKVATSAYEARNMGFLKPNDGISLHLENQITDAKRVCLQLAENGYSMPQKRNDIWVQGRTGMALFYAGINGMLAGKYISAHDQKIAQKLAYVICGGDLSTPQQVSEQYLLDLEREAFLSLCGEKKTLERIQSLLKTGKPLRN